MTRVARLRAAPLLFGLSLLLAHRAQAQTDPSRASDRGRLDLSAWIAGATGEENTDSFAEAQVWSTGVFFGWVIVADAGSGWRRGGLEYGFNLLPVVVQSRPGHIFGGGFEPIVLRWNSSHHRGPLAPFIELAGGALISNSNLPPGKTSWFNFTAKAGGGIEVSTKKHQSLDVACRWSHISNANLGVRNPEFNGIQLSVGYHWFK
ncbi:MAG TPA: acyloxyacyl hydrolase [Terriglobales bacterium]|nr:acyloxyacyl hydrolase [Terriglobales bacterium]